MLDWRSLVYPFGFLSSLAFMSRFFVQWIASEQHKKSIVPRTFWILSLIGNLLLTIHAFIQVQGHVCLIQACNAVLSARNLNLLQDRSKQWRLRSVIITLITTCTVVIAAFVAQSWIAFNSPWMLISIPHAPWNDTVSESVAIHLFGSIGIFLFASRFWVQWWHAEKQQVSLLNPTFWRLSLIGACLSIIYFTLMHDVVNAIGPAMGIIPYMRNLMLIRRQEKRTP